MIVRPPVNWLRLLFVWRGSVLPAILPQLLLIAARLIPGDVPC
jgi:putative membrane protein